MGPPKFFYMFSSKFVVLKKILRVFNICCFRNILGQKFLKNHQILAKIFQFLTQNISETTNVENSQIFFRTTNLLENM